MPSTSQQVLEPPLLRFLRALDPDGKEAFARAVDTTLAYLQQMAGQPAPNPALKLAMAIEAESHRLSRLLDIQPLTLPDLLVGRLKVQPTEDHTTGETFVLLPDGTMARRRIDRDGRLVIVNAAGRVIDVEEANPSASMLKRTKRLEDDE